MHKECAEIEKLHVSIVKTGNQNRYKDNKG